MRGGNYGDTLQFMPFLALLLLEPICHLCAAQANGSKVNSLCKNSTNSNSENIIPTSVLYNSQF
jgi:hypothetical protein